MPIREMAIGLVALIFSSCTVRTGTEHSDAGWYCYEGDPYRDASTYCGHDLETCRESRASVGIVGSPPPEGLTECAPRDNAVCGSIQIPAEIQREPLTHCHVTLRDCQDKQAAQVQNHAIVIDACATK
jgi:hypothetical protein